MTSLNTDFLQSRRKSKTRKWLLVSVIFLLAAAAGTGGFYLYKNQTRDNPQVQGADTMPKNLTADWLQKYFGTTDENDPAVGGTEGDPDADILTNIQEYLFGTDPLADDTDGDGMTDGVELVFNQNPLGEGDYQVPESGQAYVNELIAETPELQEFTEENIYKEVEAMFQPDRAIVFDLPTDGELVTNEKNNLEGFEEYYNETQALLSADLSEVEMVRNDMFSMTPDQLDKFIVKFETILGLLMDVPVPSEIINIHKFKIAALRGGKRLFEQVKNNYNAGTEDNQFWADVFYQITVTQEAGLLELAAWNELGTKLKDSGGLPE